MYTFVIKKKGVTTVDWKMQAENGPRCKGPTACRCYVTPRIYFLRCFFIRFK